jgi:hypothetical protein
MDDDHIPKQPFYEELASDRRQVGGRESDSRTASKSCWKASMWTLIYGRQQPRTRFAGAAASVRVANILKTVGQTEAWKNVSCAR